jgi:hypothetical protein
MAARREPVFPKAEPQKLYLLNNVDGTVMGLYRKLSSKEAMTNADAQRATLNAGKASECVGWFLKVTNLA